MGAHLSLEDKFRRSRKRLEVLEQLAKNPSLSPEKRRAARALARSQRVALDLRVRALAYAVNQKLH